MSRVKKKDNRGGGGRGQGRHKLPEDQLKKPFVSLQQWKIDKLIEKYGSKRAAREVFDEFTNTLIS